MKKFAIGLALVGAVVLLVGIFLPWIHYQSGSIGGFSISYSLSGWDVFNKSGLETAAAQLSSDNHALIVFIATIVMLLCALAALLLSLKSKGGGGGIVALDIIISLAAVLAIGGLIWFLVDLSSVNNWSDYIGAGIYICFVGVVLGLVGGILALVGGMLASVKGS